MNEENYKKYKEQYPNISFNTDGYMDGWNTLLEPIFAYINEFNEQEKDLGYIIHIDQIKEKFGGLRFYYSLVYDGEGDELEYDTSVLDSIIEKAESLSFKTCESCSSTRDIETKARPWWVKTLCAICAEEWLKGKR